MTKQRTDTEILEWLVKMGYIAELGRSLGEGFVSPGWTFGADSGEYHGATFRDAISNAMEALDG